MQKVTHFVRVDEHCNRGDPLEWHGVAGTEDSWSMTLNIDLGLNPIPNTHIFQKESRRNNHLRNILLGTFIRRLSLAFVVAAVSKVFRLAFLTVDTIVTRW